MLTATQRKVKAAARGVPDQWTDGLTQFVESQASYIRNLQVPESPGAIANEQWVGIVLLFVAVLVAVSAGRNLLEYLLEVRERETNPRLFTDSDERELDLLQRAPPPALLTPRERRQQQIALIRAERESERTQSYFFMIGAVAIFQFATNAFLRTPELPLQP